MSVEELLDNARSVARDLNRAENVEDVNTAFSRLQELLELHSKEPRPGEDALERQFRMLRESAARKPASMRALAEMDRKRAEAEAPRPVREFERCAKEMEGWPAYLRDDK